MNGGSLWYLFQAIKHYMQLVKVSYMDYEFDMWEVSMAVIMLILLAWVINRFIQYQNN